MKLLWGEHHDPLPLALAHSLNPSVVLSLSLFLLSLMMTLSTCCSRSSSRALSSRALFLSRFLPELRAYDLELDAIHQSGATRHQSGATSFLLYQSLILVLVHLNRQARIGAQQCVSAITAHDCASRERVLAPAQLRCRRSIARRLYAITHFSD